MKIIVDTLEDKKKLMEESRYIHNYLKGINTDKCNTLAHLYLCDNMFEVKHSHLSRKKQQYKRKENDER